MKSNRLFYIVTLIIGIGCVVASFFFKGEEVKAISGILIGIGSGLFGVSVSNLLMKHIERKNPELEKREEIEYKDERNTMIRNRAKAKAGDVTQWMVIGVAYITIIISAPLWVTLTVVAVFLIHHAVGLYLMNKYQKEM